MDCGRHLDPNPRVDYRELQAQAQFIDGPVSTVIYHRLRPDRGARIRRVVDKTWFFDNATENVRSAAKVCLRAC